MSVVSCVGFLLTLVQADTSAVRHLPLVEAQATPRGRTLAIVLSGDGNWAGFDKGLARELNARGIAVVGLKSRSWLNAPPPKTPAIAGADLEAILERYVPAWKADTVLVIGYSRGADLAPFMLTRLGSAWRKRIPLLVLLSPSRYASFEFHLSDLFSDKRRPSDIPVLSELEKVRGLPILCVYGTGDPGALCPDISPGLAKVVARRQGHRMEDPEEIALLIVAELNRLRVLPSNPAR
jgi:type IV secretory pathway VirJ component